MPNLRPYQQEAVDAVLRHFRRSTEPAVVVLPTGAGKSLVIAELARLAKGRVLVLAHVKELVEQNHAKYALADRDAGIYSAGLERRDRGAKVVFGSIQSVARADAAFFDGFSLMVIDECHRVSTEGETQYQGVVARLREQNPSIRILGLTATPYRLGLGWIYRRHLPRRLVRTDEERFFGPCVYELSLQSLIRQGFLTPPVLIDAPVVSYDFSRLERRHGAPFALADVERSLSDQSRVTPGIVANIVSLAQERQGVMIFAASVRHAREVLTHLPPETSALVTGETGGDERDEVVRRFKARELKYLVNVSVLTTGFDAPHVDLIALLRPTESVSLFQQIVGRGLRLSPGKTDCLVLDYTGQGHDLFRPEIDQDKPADGAVPVVVTCPECGHENDFWGVVEFGELVEHFGRRCRGLLVDGTSGPARPCGFRFRFKLCGACGAENDTSARSCERCRAALVDDDRKLRDAMALKDAHVMRVDSMALVESVDRRGNPRLEVRYFDADGQSLKEWFFLRSTSDRLAFRHSFLRLHLRRPERVPEVSTPADAVALQPLLRTPAFVVARKRERFWQVREKVFR